MSGHNPEWPPPASKPLMSSLPPTAAETRADDPLKALGQAYLRMSAALWVSVLGPPAQRELVGQLVDGKLGEDEARQVRDGLDEVARRVTGHRDGRG